MPMDKKEDEQKRLIKRITISLSWLIILYWLMRSINILLNDLFISLLDRYLY